MLVILLTLAMLASACSSSDGDTTRGPDDDQTQTTQTPDGDEPTTTSPGTAERSTEVELISNAPAQPLNIQLGEGQPATQIEGDADPAPTVEGDPIDDPQVEQILDRLPDLVEEPDDTEDFKRPADSLRPPISGTTINQDFPIDAGDPPPEVVTGPLEVLRFQPEGDVPLAPYLSVTFNQPMVALGTLGQLDTTDVPVTLSPDVPGHWEWIGTRTLRFESDSELFDRLPMATSYTATVPAGTTSLAGNALAAEITWTFETPTPQVEWLSPQGDSLDLDPIFIALFDQRIDAEAVLAVTTLIADGSDRTLRLATDDELAADDQRTSTENLPDDRWIAFTPTEPLPKDAQLQITVGPDVPSSEGPLVNPNPQSFRARTYAPLKVDEWNCGGRSCEPLDGFSIRFNNALDPDLFDEALISVEPEIDGMVVGAGGISVWIAGATKGDTDYKVTIDGALTDVFGQTLGDDRDHTFKVGDARPFLGGFEGDPIVLDPMADNPTLTVPVMNHEKLRIRIREVTPDDWRPYVTWRNRFDDDNPPPAPGREIVNEEIDTGAEENELTFFEIPLGTYFENSTGQIVVSVEPVGRLGDLDRNDNLYWNNRRQTTWAQRTNIGLDTYNDGRDVVVVTTALDTGEPLSGVTVQLTSSTQSLTTGADGTARLPITGVYEGLVARKGDDLVWLWGGGDKQTIVNQTQWYVIDDRGIYKPGESVRLKGWMRTRNNIEDAELELPAEATSVDWIVFGPQGNELATGTSDVSVLGGFDAEFDLPEGTNLGQARVQISTSNARHQHSFQVQEFRRPEFEVSARNETSGPYFTSEPATVAVEASYFSGGPLPNAQVDWTVTTQETTYRPPNWADFTFGRWIPWWYASTNGFDGGFDNGFPGSENASFEQFTGTTDATGSHYLQIAFGEASTETPSTVTANAAVMDVNRQVWSADTSLLVHSGQNYVGLQGQSTFVRRGEPMEINAIVTDIDGANVDGVSFDVLAEVLEWRRVDGEWSQVATNTQTCPLTSSDEAQRCSFDTETGGQYRVSAVVTDENGGKNRTELTRWVSGGKSRPSTSVERQSAELVPDQETYQPGDTAEVLVQSPFGPAEGLLILTRNKIVETRRFTIENDTTVLDIPIDASQIPNIDVHVELTGTAPRLDDDGEPVAGAKPRPAYASGQLSLRIPPISRTLEVVATPASDAIEPGAETEVDVTVRDATGAPVEGAELLMVVVDEAVLALSSYELTDPIETFYRPLQSNLRSAHTRRLIRLSKPELPNLPGPVSPQSGDVAQIAADGDAMEAVDEAMEESADFTAATSARAAVRQKADGEPIEVRSNFDALAVFEPELTTDADGTATMSFTMPDNLTRYRVMIVAVAGDDTFGSGESNITARLPLQVRPSAPRFLNFGDVFELPVVVQNQTDDDMVVDVVLEATNLTLTGPSGKQVTVPANDRVEVRFDAEANEAGTARFQAAAVSGDNADAATISLPVYTPATSEAFATYGVIDDGAVFQPLIGPAEVWPQFGGLEINTSSTAVQALTDAVIYVHEYEYRSSDAAASQILSIAALRDVLSEFDAADMPTEAELNQSVNNSIETLVGMQNRDGGFPYWQRGRRSAPYNSVHAAHALVVARQAGFDVPQQTLNSALSYLQNIEEHLTEWSAASRTTVSAYALRVRALNNDRDAAKAENIYNSYSDHSLDALAWLFPVVSNSGIRTEIARTFNNRVTETAAGATFVNNYSDDDYVLLHSNRRTDGIVLGALITEDPDSDLIPKIVNGLLANKTKGRWGNLQENTFILLALNEYFDTFEDADPDFVARVWLGGTYVAEHTYKGRTTEQNQTVVPMSVLIDEGDTNIVLNKTGAGRLYYRLGLDYAPEDLNLDPLDRGFVVQRTYEAVNDPEDVWKDDDGNWHVKAGAEVRVTLDMTADSRRTHVALVDPLPAGLEILNPALTPTEELSPNARSSNSWWWWQWFSHQNLRDDRAEAFTSYLRAGTYDYSYIARATTPGTFVVPPTKAEEMYAPETFGRSSTDILIVEAD